MARTQLADNRQFGGILFFSPSYPLFPLQGIEGGWRGGRRAEVGGWRLEGGGERAEGGRRRVEGGGWRAEGGGRRAEGGGRKVEGGGRRAEGGRRKAEGGGEGGADIPRSGIDKGKSQHRTDKPCLQHVPTSANQEIPTQFNNSSISRISNNYHTPPAKLWKKVHCQMKK